MITISLCMIVKDEESVLGRCLESVKDIVDEIIIVDTGSADKSKEIAAKFTSKIYDFEWIDDFSAARNYSFSKATMGYILWLDADDVLLAQDRDKFLWLKENLAHDIDIVLMKYNVGMKEDGVPALSFFRERLIKRSLNLHWLEPVHEYIELRGKIGRFDICITHRKEKNRTDRNINIYERLISEGRDLSPRGRCYYARELYLSGRFDEAIVCFNKLLETDDGNPSDYIDCCIDLSGCYKKKNNRRNSLKALLKSFEYDVPRAEVCCKIGYHFKEQGDYIKALFWFDLASRLSRPEDSLGSLIYDYWGFIPNVESSICCFHLGRIRDAIEYNERASAIKPAHPAVLQNRRLFNSLMKGFTDET